MDITRPSDTTSLQDQATVQSPALDAPGELVEVPTPGRDGLTVFDGPGYDPDARSFEIDGAAARLVDAFDADRDGVLQAVGGYAEISRDINGRSTTIHLLANRADELGNRDGSTSVQEVADLMTVFDSDGSGSLAGHERDAFLDALGERYYTGPVAIGVEDLADILGHAPNPAR